jgi:hypothetical protein
MSVTIWQDDHFSGNLGYFPFDSYTNPGYGYTNLSDHQMGYTGLSWNDQVSSLYTTTWLYVFEDAPEAPGGTDYALLPPGAHDLASLESYGVDNDSISAMYAGFQPYA